MQSADPGAEQYKLISSDIRNVLVISQLIPKWGNNHQKLLVPVEFYLYPTVSTALVHSVKPELTE